VATAGADLRSLKGNPFDLLEELERRSKVALAGGAAEDADGQEWVGIGFRLGDEQFIVARDEVREVLMIPPHITRVPGSKSWVSGLANVRGHLVSIVDLKSFLGAGSASNLRVARVLVANSPDSPIGLVVDEVYGFRRFLDGERSAECPQTVIRCERFLDGSYERGPESWPVFRAERLLGSDEFQQTAE
jgi:twitching motility protein PilI